MIVQLIVKALRQSFSCRGISTVNKIHVKKFVITLLKFTSNIWTVIGNILLKLVSLEPSNIKLFQLFEEMIP